VVALWWSDPAAAHVADLRIYLLKVLQPLAERFGLSAFWLPFLFYPLVAVNIVAPVILIAVLRHRRSLRQQLAGQHTLAKPWPQVSQRELRDGCEHIHLQLRPFASIVQLWILLLVIVGLFTLALWGRDSLRLMLVDDDPRIGYASILELLLVIIAARLVWWWARALVLAKFALIDDSTYDQDGWLLWPQPSEPDEERSLQGKRVNLTMQRGKDWPQRLAEGISAVL